MIITSFEVTQARVTDVGIPIPESFQLKNTDNLFITDSEGNILDAGINIRFKSEKENISWISLVFNPAKKGKYNLALRNSKKLELNNFSTHVSDKYIFSRSKKVNATMLGANTRLLNNLFINDSNVFYPLNSLKLFYKSAGIKPLFQKAVINESKSLGEKTQLVFDSGDLSGKTLYYKFESKIKLIDHKNGVTTVVTEVSPPDYSSAYVLKRNYRISDKIYPSEYTYGGEIVFNGTLDCKVGDILADADAEAIGNFTLQLEAGNIYNTEYIPFIRTENDPIYLKDAGLTFDFGTADTLKVLENTNFKKVIRQNIFFSDEPSLKCEVYYTQYFNTEFIRVEAVFTNLSDNKIDIGQLAFRFKCREAANYLLQILDEEEATQNYNKNKDVFIHKYKNFDLLVPNVASQYPKRISSLGHEVSIEVLPDTGKSHDFYGNHSFYFQFYIGKNITNLDIPNVVFSPNYIAETKRVTEHFYTGRNIAEPFTEAGERYKKLLDCGFDIESSEEYNYLGKVDIGKYRTLKNDSYYVNALGWNKFGNLGWSGSGSWSYNHYDVGYHCLVGWLRTGNKNAFKYGLQTQKYMATYGTYQNSNSSLAWNQRGMNFFERAGLNNNEPARPTHSWGAGLWLGYALTGNYILLEAAKKHAEAGSQYDKSFDFFQTNEGRLLGWPLLECVEAYRYTGQAVYLEKAKQYFDILLEKEQSFGGRGFYAHPDYIDGLTYTQPFVWGGYTMIPVIEYYYVSKDEKAKKFLGRVANWIIGNGVDLAPLRIGKVVDEKYYPAWTNFKYSPVTELSEEKSMHEASLLLPVLFFAGLELKDEKILAIAKNLMQDMAYYKDNVWQGFDKEFKYPINFRSAEFGGTTVKTFGHNSFVGNIILGILEQHYDSKTH